MSCADCEVEQDYEEMYAVRVPDSRAPNGPDHGKYHHATQNFWLCKRCWDRLVSGATMAAIR